MRYDTFTGLECCSDDALATQHRLQYYYHDGQWNCGSFDNVIPHMSSSDLSRRMKEGRIEIQKAIYEFADSRIKYIKMNPCVH